MVQWEKRLHREIMVPCLKCWENGFRCKSRWSIFLFRIEGMDRKVYKMSYFLKDFSSSTLVAVTLGFEAGSICLYAILEFLWPSDMLSQPAFSSWLEPTMQNCRYFEQKVKLTSEKLVIFTVLTASSWGSITAAEKFWCW